MLGSAGLAPVGKPLLLCCFLSCFMLEPNSFDLKDPAPFPESIRFNLGVIMNSEDQTPTLPSPEVHTEAPAPVTAYSREDLMREHPIAFRKAMQRMAAENRKRAPVSFQFGSIKMMGR